MKRFGHKSFVLLVSWLLISWSVAEVGFAGVPLNNLEGVGGVAFNPLAYPANSESSFGSTQENGKTEKDGLKFERLLGALSKPQVGSWYVRLGDVKVDWVSLGTAETFFKRWEVSYGWESVIQDGQANKYKNNIGTKFLFLNENAFGTKFLPAISGGFILKNTNHISPGADHTGFDLYVVATKLIKELPLPVLLSGGLLSTDSRTTGVFGYDRHRRETFFWNADVLPLKNVAVGFEYKYGAKFPEWKDADYWDIHGAWMVTKSLTLVGAYVYAGDYKSQKRIGLGDGFTVSLHYSF